MKTVKRNEAITKIQEATNLLLDALILIQELNKGSEQFDFTTSSTLSNSIDGTLHIANKIEKIVYQK